MENNRRQILDMLAEGKIQVEEAERLLSLVSPEAESAGSGQRPKESRSSAKYLCVRVEPGENADEDHAERVNIRVPMALIRAGVKLATVIPRSSEDSVNEELKKRGIKFEIGSLKAEDLDPLVDALQDLEVDVNNGRHTVRVYVE
ncbi:MAG: hypothetical protein IH872_02325 [Chloroflexi bacterium]|nr:hypothetical protein [Chloroflexota bacterium]